MGRKALAYGLALAAVAVLVEVAAYRHLIRQLSVETYILVIAATFIALGLFVGVALTPRRARSDFVRNEAAIASLGLTPRELDVLDAIARGEANKEIARRFDISPNTVKTHIASLTAKLGVSGRGRAVDQARRLSLLP